MSHFINNSHFIGFKASDRLLGRLNSFLEAVEVNDKIAGAYYVDFIEELTTHINQRLLLEMVEIAEISKVGQKVVNICVSSSNKVSGMLSSKIYKKRSVSELQPIAELWKERLTSGQADEASESYLIAPIAQEFGEALASIIAEKGTDQHFAPKDIDNVMNEYDRLSKAIIDSFFLEATRMVEIGGITKKMIDTGVSTVEKAVESVFQKVIKPLEPAQFGRFVEHTSQFHVRF